MRIKSRVGQFVDRKITNNKGKLMVLAGVAGAGATFYVMKGKTFNIVTLAEYSRNVAEDAKGFAVEDWVSRMYSDAMFPLLLNKEQFIAYLEIINPELAVNFVSGLVNPHTDMIEFMNIGAL